MTTEDMTREHFVRVETPSGLQWDPGQVDAVFDRAAPVVKRCSHCGAFKRVEAFHRERRSRHGFMARCRDCVNASKRAQSAARAQWARERRDRTFSSELTVAAAYRKGLFGHDTLATRLRNRLSDESCMTLGDVLALVGANGRWRRRGLGLGAKSLWRLRGLQPCTAPRPAEEAA